MTLPILTLPCWRYHATQGGKIFHTREEIEEAEAHGWRDSPATALEAVDIDNLQGTKPLASSAREAGDPSGPASLRPVPRFVNSETAIDEPQAPKPLAKKQKR